MRKEDDNTEYPILEQGKVYFVFEKNTDFFLLGKVTNNDLKPLDIPSSYGSARCLATYIYFNYYENQLDLNINKTWAYWTDNLFRDYRAATRSEVIWLEKCIAARKCVKRPLLVCDFIFKK